MTPRRCDDDATPKRAGVLCYPRGMHETRAGLRSGLAGLLLLGVAAASAASAGGCARDGGAVAVSGEDAAKLLINRNWLDSWPRRKDDHLLVYRFVPTMGGGVYQDRTVFKGQFELFQFEATGDAVRFVFPHTDERTRARYQIERVRGPEPFDLKLTIDPDPRGPGVFYGLTRDRGADVEQLVAAAGADRR